MKSLLTKHKKGIGFFILAVILFMGVYFLLIPSRNSEPIEGSWAEMKKEFLSCNVDTYYDTWDNIFIVILKNGNKYKIPIAEVSDFRNILEQTEEQCGEFQNRVISTLAKFKFA